MRFFDAEEEWVLPFSGSDILQMIYDQLKHGTIFIIEPLKRFLHKPGIKFHTRLELGYIPNETNPYYKVSNDERRKLMLALLDMVFNPEED